MCFGRRKMEKKRDQYTSILMDAIRNMGIDEKYITGGYIRETNVPFAGIEEEYLESGVSKYLGEKGKFQMRYIAKEKKLESNITFTFEKGSDEAELLKECLDYFDYDSEYLAKGEMYGHQIIYFTQDKTTRIVFYSENVCEKDLLQSAKYFFEQMFDWLGETNERFKEEYLDFDDEDDDGEFDDD